LDVDSCRVATGTEDSPYLTLEGNAGELGIVARDDLNHGSLVLHSLLAVNPELPVVLVRAYNDEVKLVRTKFAHGSLVQPGWTEAYRTAVAICRKRGLATVANLSFGGYTHAMDGSGWESHSLAQETGAGKSGHIVLAGASAGNGAAIHSSWSTQPGETTEVKAFQSCPTTYNLWCAADAGTPESNDWVLEAFLNGRLISREMSDNLAPNLWNNRKQVTIHVPGAGQVIFRTSRFFNNGGDFGRVHSNYRFDAWVVQSDCNAVFLDHKDVMSIAEPAIFPHVIAVGLKSGEYAANQAEPGAKPELLIDGGGPISFRLPEVAAKVAQMLSEDPALDVVAVRAKLSNKSAASSV
jgi:hypothetical protein